MSYEERVELCEKLDKMWSERQGTLMFNRDDAAELVADIKEAIMMAPAPKDLNVYRIISDIINDEEIVVATSVDDAIRKYCVKYKSQYVRETNVTKVERIAEKVLT